MSKAVVLSGDLREEVIADASAEAGVRKAYIELCPEKAREDGHEHGPLKAQIDSLEAAIAKDYADTQNTLSEIDALIAKIGTADTELKEARHVSHV